MAHLVILTTLLLIVLPCRAVSHQLSVINNCKSPISVYWMDSHVLQRRYRIITSGVKSGNVAKMSSYNGTSLLIVKTGKPTENVTFIKGNEDEIVSLTDRGGLAIEAITEKQSFRQKLQFVTKTCSKRPRKQFFECVASSMSRDILDLQKEIDDLVTENDKLAERLRWLTCLDDFLETTRPINTTSYHLSSGQVIQVEELWATQHSKIWKVDDFVSSEECQVFLRHGKPNLSRATVSGDGGVTKISENRRAQQASYDISPESRDTDPLWPLYSRILELTSLHTGFELKPDGQEDFVIIQYNPSDEYLRHCDGKCDGEPYISKGRMATSVIYCVSPDAGGGTSFTKSDVFVQPRNGSAVFFSYRGLDGRTDLGFTEHSGCPVKRGEKWIVTAWMREGVSLEDTYQGYDPDGIPKDFSDAEDDGSEDDDEETESNDEEMVDNEEESENSGEVEEEDTSGNQQVETEAQSENGDDGEAD